MSSSKARAKYAADLAYLNNRHGYIPRRGRKHMLKHPDGRQAFIYALDPNGPLSYVTEPACVEVVKDASGKTLREKRETFESYAAALSHERKRVFRFRRRGFVYSRF